MTFRLPHGTNYQRADAWPDGWETRPARIGERVAIGIKGSVPETPDHPDVRIVLVEDRSVGGYIHFENPERRSGSGELFGRSLGEYVALGGSIWSDK